MSCADVCIDMDYDESNAFYHEAIVVARKAHQCCECRETIPPGSRYQRVTGKSDGDVWTSKTCADCMAIRNALVCGSWVFGLLWEEIEQGVFPAWLTTSPIDCLAKIDELSARQKLRDRFAEWKAEN